MLFHTRLTDIVTMLNIQVLMKFVQTMLISTCSRICRFFVNTAGKG